MLKGTSLLIFADTNGDCDVVCTAKQSAFGAKLLVLLEQPRIPINTNCRSCVIVIP